MAHLLGTSRARRALAAARHNGEPTPSPPAPDDMALLQRPGIENIVDHGARAGGDPHENRDAIQSALRTIKTKWGGGILIIPPGIYPVHPPR